MPSAETLALLLWCGMVLLKLVGLLRWWQRSQVQPLSRRFSQELRRRGLPRPIGMAPEPSMDHF